MRLSEFHDTVCDRLRALPGIESDLLFVYNEDESRVSVQVMFRGEWIESTEDEDTESAAFQLLQRLSGSN